jgi:hypothetical protein
MAKSSTFSATRRNNSSPWNEASRCSRVISLINSRRRAGSCGRQYSRSCRAPHFRGAAPIRNFVTGINKINNLPRLCYPMPHLDHGGMTCRPTSTGLTTAKFAYYERNNGCKFWSLSDEAKTNASPAAPQGVASVAGGRDEFDAPGAFNSSDRRTHPGQFSTGLICRVSA